MEELSVNVRELTKSFGGRKVVDALSFTVKKGEVFALLGHNGAGKSTTIDLILGLKTPDAGTATVLGMNAAKNRKQVFEMYCSPCSPARLLACDTLASGVMAVLSTLILTVAAVAVFGYRMQGSVLVYMAVWLLTMASMFAIGLMVASLCRTTKSMNVATTALYFPMLLFSGATIPAEVFPAGFRAVARWMPLGIGIDLLKSVSLGCYDRMAVPVLTLTAMAVLCGAVAVKTFRWE